MQVVLVIDPVRMGLGDRYLDLLALLTTYYHLYAICSRDLTN